MINNKITLHELSLGCSAKVKALKMVGKARRHMLDLGLIVDTCVEAIQKSPSGDPKAYYIRGAVIALRSEDASMIMVEPIWNE